MCVCTLLAGSTADFNALNRQHTAIFFYKLQAPVVVKYSQRKREIEDVDVSKEIFILTKYLVAKSKLIPRFASHKCIDYKCQQ